MPPIGEIKMNIKLQTDSGGDGYGVEQRPGERPLQTSLIHIVVSVPTLILHGRANLSLERAEDLVDASGEVLALGCGSVAVAESPAPSPRTHRSGPHSPYPRLRNRRCHVPRLVHHPLAAGDHPYLDALLERRLERAEQEAAHDGVGDHHAGQADVREEKRGDLFAAGHQPLPLPPPTLATTLAVEHLPHRLAVQLLHRHVARSRGRRTGSGRDRVFAHLPEDEVESISGRPIAL